MIGRRAHLFAARVPQPQGVSSAYAAILTAGAVLWWLSRSHPALMPFWMPWDFSPLIYLTTALLLLWYFRGLRSTPAAERPATWRRLAFLIGVAAIYGVLQTRFEYLSQHMFFLNRAQHVVMHHLGPF
jgi:putative membrane protein